MVDPGQFEAVGCAEGSAVPERTAAPVGVLRDKGVHLLVTDIARAFAVTSPVSGKFLELHAVIGGIGFSKCINSPCASRHDQKPVFVTDVRDRRVKFS